MYITFSSMAGPTHSLTPGELSRVSRDLQHPIDQTDLASQDKNTLSTSSCPSIGTSRAVHIKLKLTSAEPVGKIVLSNLGGSRIRSGLHLTSDVSRELGWELLQLACTHVRSRSEIPVCQSRCQNADLKNSWPSQSAMDTEPFGLSPSWLVDNSTNPLNHDPHVISARFNEDDICRKRLFGSGKSSGPVVKGTVDPPQRSCILQDSQARPTQLSVFPWLGQ